MQATPTFSSRKPFVVTRQLRQKSQSDRREWPLRTGDGFPPVVYEAVSTRAVTSVANTIRANPKSVEILGGLLAVLEIAPACLEVPAMR